MNEIIIHQLKLQIANLEYDLENNNYAYLLNGNYIEDAKKRHLSSLNFVLENINN